MIVVDTNVLAYFLLPGEFTALAERAWARDADWQAPTLWRSELCNVLVQYVRHGPLSLEDAQATLKDADALMQGRVHRIVDLPVLARATALGCSAYDAEFVALAEALACPLVTSDRRLVRAAEPVAVLLHDFVGEAS